MEEDRGGRRRRPSKEPMIVLENMGEFAYAKMMAIVVVAVFSTYVLAATAMPVPG